MRCDHIPCGEFVNKSEEDAIEHLKSCLAKLAGQGRWILLSNLPSAVNERAIPDEIDLVAIGPSGLFVVEIKHWDRGFLKSNLEAVQSEANKLNDKVRRLAGKLRRAGIDPGFLAGRFLLTKDGPRWDKERPVHHGSRFFGPSEWKSLLEIDGGAVFDEAAIQKATVSLQPLFKVTLTGQVRRIADSRNLELHSPTDDHFYRIYRGELSEHLMQRSQT